MPAGPEDMARRMQNALAQALRQAASRVSAHSVPLAIILLACVLGQGVVLTQRPLSVSAYDTASYLLVAHRLLTSHLPFDPMRTPGYPALLAVLFALTGGQHMETVVLVQAALIVLTTLEVYVLAWRLGAPRWLATLLGVLLGLDPFVLATARTILTEPLAYWLVVTLCLTFERLLRRPRPPIWVSFALLAVAAILTRPNLILLPALLLLVLALRTWRLQRRLPRRTRPQEPARDRAPWRALALTGGAIYAVLVAYVLGNGLTVHYFGLSYLTNMTLFEKVYEYRLYALPFNSSDPQLLRLHAELQAFARDPQELSFPRLYPDATTHFWAGPGHLAVAEIEQHPLVYLAHSLPTVVAATYADPYPIAPWRSLPGWMGGLAAVFSFAARLYAFLPLLLVLAGVQAWRHIERVERVMLFALLLALTGHLVLTGLVDYIEFWRLRFPLDWILPLAIALALVEWIPALAGGLARLRQGKSPFASQTA